jgi:uncharacterized protein YjbI with pentapeptide repeats
MRTNFKRKCALCYKHLLKILAAVILPLLLAIFTVVITFEQRKENDQQRFEDRELARIHREQDLNISILTREADKLAAQLQRENDRDIANNQRNTSQILENYRYEQERIKYLDTLLANYINEIGQLLIANNGSLTSNSAVMALSRSKTLHILRTGIGPIRASQIIQYLYDAGQLNANNNPLDLSNAPFDGISLNGLSMRFLFLARTRLSNASFTNLDVSYGNFSGAYMIGTNFSSANCLNVDFTGTNLFQTDFSNAKLIKTTFVNAILSHSTLINAALNDANFLSTDLSYTNLSHAICIDTIFYKANMIKSDLSYTILARTKFNQTNLTEAIFSSADSSNYNFNKCFFDTVQLKQANFTNVTLMEVMFIKSNMIESIFRRAQIQYISIISSNATHSDFTDANLHNGKIHSSVLTFASFVNANIEGTTFRYTDLSNANLSNATYFDSINSWNEPLSIYNARLPDGTIGTLNNLISKSNVQCNLSVEEHGWIVNENNSILIEHHWNNSKKCIFTLSSNCLKAKMSLSVNLSRFTELIESGQAIALLRIHGSQTVNIWIKREQSLDGLIEHIAYYNKNGFSMLIGRIHNDMRNMEIQITFNILSNQSYPVWLEYIELTISLYLGYDWY